MAKAYAAYQAYTEALKEAGVYVDSAGLRPTAEATTVRARPARSVFWTVRSPRRKNSSTATIWSMSPIWMRPWCGRNGIRPWGSVRSKSVPCGGNGGRRGDRAPQLRKTGRLSRRAYARVARAEDALSEAFAAALADWPVSAMPGQPEAWLLTVARRKSIDAVRKRTNELAICELRTSMTYSVRPTRAMRKFPTNVSG